MENKAQDDDLFMNLVEPVACRAGATPLFTSIGLKVTSQVLINSAESESRSYMEALSWGAPANAFRSLKICPTRSIIGSDRSVDSSL